VSMAETILYSRWVMSTFMQNCGGSLFPLPTGRKSIGRFLPVVTRVFCYCRARQNSLLERKAENTSNKELSNEHR